MPSLATYKVLGIRAHGVFEIKKRGAPAESAIMKWAKDKGCQFVSRYYPSKRGWRLIDLRNAQAFEIPVPGQRRALKWTGHVRGTKYYETEDQAVMVAMHMIGCTP
jgi:hypothetical protein